MDNRTLEEVRKNEDRLINELEQLQQENQELKAKIKTYEDPEDLTLMFMYCDEKVKDKIKELKKQLHEASIKMQEMIEQDIECPSNCSKLKELKKQLEELEEENFNLRENIYIEKMSFSSEGRNIKELIEMSTYEDLLNQQKEFIDYLENEKDRLARECSHIYENSLGKTRLVNEDIFNEVDTILSKYKGIIGGNDE